MLVERSKTPIERSFGVRDAPYYGFLSMAHEVRTDWAMLLGSLFLLLVGGG